MADKLGVDLREGRAVQAQLREKRRFTRYDVAGSILGSWYNGDVELEVMLLDASRQGLGVLVDQNLSSGDELLLRLDREQNGVSEVKFVVRWCRDEASSNGVPGLEDIKRCGLKVLAPEFDPVSFLREVEGIRLEE